jgi:hypothetical protein
MKLLLIGVFLVLLDGCSSSERFSSAGDQESPHQISHVNIHSFIESGDSVHPGPTAVGERESIRKQVNIVKAVVFLAAIVWFFWMFGRWK